MHFFLGHASRILFHFYHAVASFWIECLHQYHRALNLQKECLILLFLLVLAYCNNVDNVCQKGTCKTRFCWFACCCKSMLLLFWERYLGKQMKGCLSWKLIKRIIALCYFNQWCRCSCKCCCYIRCSNCCRQLPLQRQLLRVLLVPMKKI